MHLYVDNWHIQHWLVATSNSLFFVSIDFHLKLIVFLSLLWIIIIIPSIVPIQNLDPLLISFVFELFYKLLWFFFHLAPRHLDVKRSFGNILVTSSVSSENGHFFFDTVFKKNGVYIFYKGGDSHTLNGGLLLRG